MDGKGVTFTTPLAVTSQFPFCSLPLRLDSYRGCAFDCAYCFARSRGGNVPDSKIVPADPQALRMAFRAAQGNSTSLVAEMLRRRVPIHFGGMSDPFQPAEKRHRVTAHFLETVVEYNHPVVISTKSHLLCDEPYLTLIQECKSIVCQFSFCSLLDRRAAHVEPYSSSPTRLLEAVRQLSSMGVPVTARWQPYIAEFSEDPEDFVPAVAAAGVRHVSLEHLKIPVEGRMSLLNGKEPEVLVRTRSLYKEAMALRDGREFVLPSLAKVATILRVRDACRRAHILFGAADNDFQYFSDGEACCSGVDGLPGFENIFKFQIGCAVKRSVGRAIVASRVSDEWRPAQSVDRYLNSRSRMRKRFGVIGTIEEHFTHRWNTPTANGSPASYFGVRPTNARSPDGNLVYEWAPESEDLLARLNTR